MQAYWSWIGEEHFQMSFFFQRAGGGGGLKPAQWSADCCLIDLIVCFPPALPAHRPMTGFWLLPLHACRSNPPRTTAPPQSQHQLNLTVLNEWNNTELTSRENPPHYHFPQSLLYYSVYWPAEGCDGSVQIYAKKKKKPSLLAYDCQLNHSLWLDPWGQLELLGHCACRDFKVLMLCI